MTVVPLIPDIAPVQIVRRADGSAFEKVLGELSAVLDRATSSEDRFSQGSGNLQDAIYDRARADVALSVAAAAAQRTVQALQTILTMQV